MQVELSPEKHDPPQPLFLVFKNHTSYSIPNLLHVIVRGLKPFCHAPGRNCHRMLASVVADSPFLACQLTEYRLRECADTEAQSQYCAACQPSIHAGSLDALGALLRDVDDVFGSASNFVVRPNLFRHMWRQPQADLLEPAIAHVGAMLPSLLRAANVMSSTLHEARNFLDIDPARGSSNCHSLNIEPLHFST